MTELATLGAIALALAAGLLIEVDLPRGGTVPVGHALLVAFASLLAPVDYLAVVAVALVLTTPVVRRRGGPALERLAGSSAGAAVALGAAQVVALLPTSRLAADLVAVIGVVGAGLAFFAADLGVRRAISGRGRAVGITGALQGLPISVTLLCAAALVAIAWGHSRLLALVAAAPILVTRYSFRRYAQAREAARQTIEALSLLPEVAGHTPLGHGERTACYAVALAEAFELDPSVVDRVATAARLHHIGHVSLHEPEERTGPPDPAELGRVGAEILRDTGFLADVAELVEAVLTPGSGGGLEAAIVRVSSTLDDLTGGEAGHEPPVGAGKAEDPFLAVLRVHGQGTDRAAAIALLRLHEERPHLLAEAARASERLAEVVAEHAAAAAAHAHAH